MILKTTLLSLATTICACGIRASRAEADSIPVTIEVEVGKPIGELRPIWRFFGYDEANYTYMKDGKKLLSELGQLGKPQVYVRCHHLLTSGDGSPALKWGSTGVYTEDAQGNPIYNWTIVDRIFDTYLERGLKPYAQIGFMPEALSTHPQDYPHNPPATQRAPANAGQAYPPKDYAKWGELVYQWTKHCVDKYGKNEVEQWYWEVWNEPNISYWHGTPEDYCKLYDYAVDGVRRALPTARVGGPETAGGPGGKFLRTFLEHCAHETSYVTGKTGSPLDFVSFHAKGSPTFANDHVHMGMSNQLKNINDAFGVVASFPEYKNTPIVIGESDPEGCAACKGPQNGYRNGTMYSSYTAASFARKFELAEKHGVNFEGALTWAFEFEDQPYFAGFRALATNGIDLPVLNVFRMFAKMSGQRVAVTSSNAASAESILKSGVRGNADVSALASTENGMVFVLAWHYHDDDLPGPDAAIDLSLTGLPADSHELRVTQYLIDETHSNAYAEWKRMGSPASPTSEQYAQLESAGKLAAVGPTSTLAVADGKSALKIVLPRQAVALFVLERP
jgi:xylan 1,4-beta-xylosidase